MELEGEGLEFDLHNLTTQTLLQALRQIHLLDNVLSIIKFTGRAQGTTW